MAATCGNGYVFDKLLKKKKSMRQRLPQNFAAGAQSLNSNMARERTVVITKPTEYNQTVKNTDGRLVRKTYDFSF